MIRLKTFSLFTALLSTVFLFLFFSSSLLAQSSSSLYNIYSPQTDYSNIYVPQMNYSSIYAPQIDYSNIYEPQVDYSNIYTPESDQSNIYVINQDLVDHHRTSLYESIHSSANSGSSLLIVKDDDGNVISIINANEIKNKKNNF